MRDLEKILDKVAKASKTKEVKEALNAYCAMVSFRKTLGGKYAETMQPLYRRGDQHSVEIVRSYKQDIRFEVYQMIENQGKRVIELMGLFDVAKQNNLGSILYDYGKGRYSYERLIQLLITVVWWDYFYSQKKLQSIFRRSKKLLIHL